MVIKNPPKISPGLIFGVGLIIGMIFVLRIGGAYFRGGGLFSGGGLLSGFYGMLLTFLGVRETFTPIVSYCIDFIVFHCFISINIYK